MQQKFPAKALSSVFSLVLFYYSVGQLVYHGPREHVLEFFESLGFKLPPRKGTADFLQVSHTLSQSAKQDLCMKNIVGGKAPSTFRRAENLRRLKPCCHRTPLPSMKFEITLRLR